MFGLAAGGCAGSRDAEVSGRWEAYPGCNLKQCATWGDECTAECVNHRDTSVTECDTKCRVKVAECETSCPG